VRLVSAGSMSHTLTMVQVRTDETGTVHIQAPPDTAGLTG
jgi:hypothetical protein